MPQPLVIFTVWLLIVLGAALEGAHTTLPAGNSLWISCFKERCLGAIFWWESYRDCEGNLLDPCWNVEPTKSELPVLKGREHHFSLTEQGIIQQGGSQWFNLHPNSKQTTFTGSSPLQEGDPYLSESFSTTKPMAWHSALHPAQLPLGAAGEMLVLSPGAC